MTFKDQLIISRYAVMQIRARGLPLKRRNAMQEEIDALKKELDFLKTALTDIAAQRDHFARLCTGDAK